MSEYKQVIPSEELGKVPLNARMVFGTRCLRRVGPVFFASWPSAPKVLADAVPNTIEAIECSRPADDIANLAETLHASVTLLKGNYLDEFRRIGSVLFAAHSLLRAAIDADRLRNALKAKRRARLESDAYFEAAAVVEDSGFENKWKVADAVADLHAVVRSNCGPTDLHAVEAGIKGDFARLLEAARHQGWDDVSSVSPDTFGPMWEANAPAWWKAIDTIGAAMQDHTRLLQGQPTGGDRRSWLARWFRRG